MYVRFSSERFLPREFGCREQPLEAWGQGAASKDTVKGGIQFTLHHAEPGTTVIQVS